MYERLQELISSGDYKEALYEFQEEFLHIDRQTDEDAARLCLLEASLWEALEDSFAEFDAIARGIKYDPQNYELFYMLGLFYKDVNINKAYLCVQQALLYCEVPEDAAAIRDMLFELEKDGSLRVKKLSIMVLSYNDPELLKKCIESIENTCFLEDTICTTSMCSFLSFSHYVYLPNSFLKKLVFFTCVLTIGLLCRI